MVLTLVITSKHKKSFLIYLYILHTIFNNFRVIKKLVNKNNHKVKFALLKSPHINKKAQYHFGFNTYKRKLIIFLIDSTKFILLTKLFTWKLFHDINVIVNYNFFKKIEVNTIKCFFIYFKTKILIFSNIIKKISKMIQVLNFISLKVLLKPITQRKSIRLINEKLTVQFCFG